MTRLALAALLLACTPAAARDQGQWGNVDRDTRQWFQGLQNVRGDLCCDTSDGSRVPDPHWRVEGEGYSVFLSGRWERVPSHLIVRGTNRVGFAIAWVYPVGSGQLRCFLPGTAS